MPIFRKKINSALRSKSPLQIEIASTSRSMGVKGLIRQSVAFARTMHSSKNINVVAKNQERVLEARKKGYLGAKK
jgi:hypothetical protein